MSQQLFCKVGDREYGPISPSVLQEWVQGGRLSPTDLVRAEGGQWHPAKGIKGLAWPTVSPPAESPAQSSAFPWEDSGNGVASAVTALGHRMTKKLGKTPTSWLAIFDWRFEYYLTPWIIRFLWVAFLLLTAGLILLNILGLVWGLLPDMSSASSSPHFGGGGGGYGEPSFLPSWLTERFVKVVVFVVSLVGSIIAVLVTRMILELMIVVFRIAEDIGMLKRKYAEGKG